MSMMSLMSSSVDHLEGGPTISDKILVTSMMHDTRSAFINNMGELKHVGTSDQKADSTIKNLILFVGRLSPSLSLTALLSGFISS